MTKWVLLILISALSCATPLNAQNVASKPPVLRAGAAVVDITPQQFPLNMLGEFAANMAERAHDPLHARALVLDDGTTLSMVVVDNLGVAPEVLEEAKAIALQQTGIPIDHMLICSTHTHSGPQSNATEGSEPEIAYRKLLVDGLAKSIVQACTARQPASLGTASHPLPDEVFNRRWFLKLGKMPLNPFGKLDIVKMNPGTSPDVLDRPAEPTDPELTVISVQDLRRKPLALFANYNSKTPHRSRTPW